MSPLRYSLLALTAWALAAGAASAQTGSGRAEATPAGSQPAVRSSTKPISDTELQALSGGQAVAVNEQQLKAVSSDNSVNAYGNVTNGPVNLSANAFSGFSGLGNFVINTGNNNTLQGSMSVNITMTPSP
jgi:hypothetical protein